MANKKRFSISSELANGIRSTIQSASTHQGQLHYDMMPLDMIELDPSNPRRLSITPAMLRDKLNPLYICNPTQLEELEVLNELAESIKRIGIRNAIEVYKEGPKYRVISGERRYLAATKLNLKSVPVRINQKPNEFDLRYIQWVENINRQDLSLYEKYNNLKLIADAYQKTHQIEFDVEHLKNLLGVSKIQAYRYFYLLNADANIIELVKIGKLTNLKIIHELMSMKNSGAFNQILSWIKMSTQEITSLSHYRDVTGKKKLFTKLNSQRPIINLGKINNPDIAKYILDRLLTDERLIKYQHKLRAIDSSSPHALSKAFKMIFKVLEQEFKQ